MGRATTGPREANTPNEQAQEMYQCWCNVKYAKDIIPTAFIELTSFDSLSSLCSQRVVHFMRCLHVLCRATALCPSGASHRRGFNKTKTGRPVTATIRLAGAAISPVLPHYPIAYPPSRLDNCTHASLVVAYLAAQRVTVSIPAWPLASRSAFMPMPSCLPHSILA